MFRFLNLEVFQGSLHRKNYFEGWYYKAVSRGREYSLSVIPGISTGREDAHAFIQVIFSGGKTAYFRFPAGDFAASGKSLSICIGKNRFSDSGMKLSLNSKDMALSGELTFAEAVPFPKSFLRRGIMGPFTYVPFMECYHGIVHIRHTVAGSLTMDGNVLDFSGGSGYIEKDWGQSFPSSWIWLQSCFPEENAVVMFSMADIPFLHRRFCGVLSFLYKDGRYYSIATYNGAKFGSFSMGGNRFSLELKNKKYALLLEASRAESGVLKAPVKGHMHRTIEETLKANITADFRTARGGRLFYGQTAHGGLEISGDTKYLMRSAKFYDRR